jgi:hypothetical protein
MTVILAILILALMYAPGLLVGAVLGYETDSYWWAVIGASVVHCLLGALVAMVSEKK